MVEGSDIAGIWAGIAWLEWEMRTRRGPFLPIGVFEKQTKWPVQISQGPWGANYSVPDLSPEYLSDDGFRLYAHYGVNTMMIHGDLLCYVKSDIFPELTHPDYNKHIEILKGAVCRALRYGVRFSYHVEAPKLRDNHPIFLQHPGVRGSGFDSSVGPVHVLCSSSEQTLAFYEETFNRLFSEVPELAGITLIPYSESFFHCRMWERPAYPCPCCFGKPPENSLVPLLNRIANSVKKVQPRAYVGVWFYSYLLDPQVMFDKFSKDIAILHSVDAGWRSRYKKDGYTKVVWDYSIDYLGPSPDAAKLADYAHRTNRNLFIKTETGIGLEVCQFPYVPAMQRLADKWQIVRNLKPFGVHQSWFFFGMFGSRAEELGFWAAYGTIFTKDEFLRKIAARDFGPEAVSEIMTAWECMSRAMGHIPCICLPYYFQGPGFLGPAHPLIPIKEMEIPEIYYEYCRKYAEETFYVGENKNCMVLHTLPDSFSWSVVPEEPSEDVWNIIIREYHSAANEAESSWRHLQAALRLTRTDTDKKHLREETLLTELIFRTMQTCEYTILFLVARREYERIKEVHFRNQMKRIAKLEKENALSSKPVYQEAPWLDLVERTDRRFPSCIDMIETKVRIIDNFLAS
ncbi:MAG: hypothetical protein V2A65_10465 [Candidatus Omnitrophota bacterium]